MIQIKNLTPHPVTIIRPNGTRVEYPACAPAELPRAVESAIGSIGDMALSCAASDGQGGYENSCSLLSTGIVDFVGYIGVEGLPPFARGERMFGVGTFYIVSIVTAIGALADGRGIEDLLVPMGQVRDASGRIVGATGLSPATSLLTPLYDAIVAPYRASTLSALTERNEARRERDALLAVTA